MYFIIQFIITILKSAIQASVYAFIITMVLILISKILKKNIIKRRFRKLKFFWFRITVLISIILVIYSFTYWGNKGYGQKTIVPIGYYKKIVAEDIFLPYLKNKKLNENKKIYISEFVTYKQYLCGKYEPSRIKYGSTVYRYFILDMKADTIKNYINKDHYDMNAKSLGFPKSDEFLNFLEQYLEYFGRKSWRFWLLP